MTAEPTPTVRACQPLPSFPVSDEVLAEIEPGPRALLESYNAARPRFAQDNFMRIGESLAQMLVCTSMTDAEVILHLVDLPSGTSAGWRLLEGQPEPPAGRCPNRPETHRHLLIAVWVTVG